MVPWSSLALASCIYHWSAVDGMPCFKALRAGDTLRGIIQGSVIG
jgi:hypothetical protein